MVEAGCSNEPAAAIRDHQGLRCDYRDEPSRDRAVPPGRLAATVVPRRPRPATGDWAPYRVDWLRLRTPGGRRFAPRRSRAT